MPARRVFQTRILLYRSRKGIRVWKTRRVIGMPQRIASGAIRNLRLFHAFDVRPHRPQLLLDLLITAIDVINPVDLRRTLPRQAS